VSNRGTVAFQALRTPDEVRSYQARQAWWRRRAGDVAYRTLVHALLVTGAVLVLMPFLWMISTSLKNQAEVFIFPPRWIPKEILWRNYIDFWQVAPFPRWVANTLYLVIAILIGTLLSNSLIAYGFARLRAPDRDFLFIVLLATMMLPGQVTMIPMYLIFAKLGWIDTYWPLIVPAFTGSAFTVFLLRQFYMTIPYDMDDAATIDGCGILGVWWRILLPMSKPALGIVTVFSIRGTWGEFLRPLIYLNDSQKLTVAVGLRMFTHGSGVGVRGQTQWGWMMAAATLYALPMIIMFFIAQRYFIQGIVITGVKG